MIPAFRKVVLKPHSLLYWDTWGRGWDKFPTLHTQIALWLPSCLRSSFTTSPLNSTLTHSCQILQVCRYSVADISAFEARPGHFCFPEPLYSFQKPLAWSQALDPKLSAKSVQATNTIDSCSFRKNGQLAGKIHGYTSLEGDHTEPLQRVPNEPPL